MRTDEAEVAEAPEKFNLTRPGFRLSLRLFERTPEGLSMTKSELIEAVAKRSEITLDRAAIVVNAVFDQMVEAMKRGERIEVRNFGNFTVKEYEGYEGRNPKTGEKVDVPPKRLPFFKAGLGLRQVINGKR
jgi:integration host factor subunit beta